MGKKNQAETIIKKIKESKEYQQIKSMKNKLKDTGKHYQIEEIKNKIKEMDIYQQSKTFRNKLKKHRINREVLKEIYDDLCYEELDKKIFKKPKHPEKIIDKTIPKTEVAVKLPNTSITIKAILKVSTHAKKYANERIPRNKWVEVIGILSGKLVNNERDLIIKNAYPMGHGNAVYAEINDYQSYIRAWRNIRENKEFIVGWYHSHPSYTPFLSDEDFSTHSRYQKLWDRAVALVIDPYQIDGTRLGFEIFRVNIQDKSWGKIPFEVRDNIDVRVLPEILEFIQPIIEGKAEF